MRRFAHFALVASIAAAALGAPAHANGRPPGTSTIHFRQGHPEEVAAGMTFGLVLSHDNGQTWRWMCEKAVGYGGLYDPRYAYTSTGALFATTFDGLKVSRDGCTFGTTSEGATFVSSDSLAPNGDVRFAPSDPADGHLYVSTNDGMTFTMQTSPGLPNDWWQSIEVAPSDSMRVYLAGYRLAPPNPIVFLLYKSIDGGANWTPMSLTGIGTMPNSKLEIVGIDHADPNTLYLRVNAADNAFNDTLYRTTNGGASWTQIIPNADPSPLPAFVARMNGDIVAGTLTSGSWVSHNKGTSWTALVNPPHVNCFAENPSGEVWACTQNYGGQDLPSDDAGIMKSQDLANWTKVLRYQDLLEPVACDAGTDQHDTCAPMWCAFCQQIGCTVTDSSQCTQAVDGANTITDAGHTIVTPPGKKGSCDASTGGATGLVVLLGVAGVFLRPRRRRALH